MQQIAIKPALVVPDQKNPYDPKPVNALLARIASMLPGAVSFRTDRYRGEPIAESNMVRGVLEFEYTSLKFGLYSDEAKLYRHIHGATGLHSNRIPELVNVMRELGNINNAGAWMLDKSCLEPFEYGAGKLNDEVLPDNHYLVETCQFLGEDLTRVHRIEISHQGLIKPGRRVPKRHFFRFFDGEGRELAALDGAGFTLHARQQILQRDSDKCMLRLNLYRMQLWAEQLGTDPDALAEIFQTLNFMAGGLHLTGMRLKD